jgi:hypothetical protein
MSASEGLPKIKLFSNLNYSKWSGEIRAWLIRNGLWKLVSGKLPQTNEECPMEILKLLEEAYLSKKLGAHFNAYTFASKAPIQHGISPFSEA